MLSMTDDQGKLLAVFEARIRQLMFICDNLRLENDELKTKLAAEKEFSLSTLEEVKMLNTKYDNLKMARIISVKQDDLKGAKQRLSKLVREVDKCIALLNE